MDVEAHAPNDHRTVQYRELRAEAEQEQHEARIQQQPARAHHQKKTEVTPAVAPAAQVWRAAATVRRQRRRNLGHAESGELGLDHHLARELHARRDQVQAADRFPVEPAEAAVEIADVRAEQKASDERQHRIAEITMERGHCARCDSARESIAHHQLVTATQPLDERLQAAEIVAVVGTAPDTVAAAGAPESSTQRATVTPLLDVHDTRPCGSREPLRAVGRAIVRDEYLAIDPRSRYECTRLGDTAGDGR